MKEVIIKFYSVNEPYGEFSNFALYPIKIKGKYWPTTEHYFQAQKFVGTPQAEKIRKAKSPMLAAQLGRNRKIRTPTRDRNDAHRFEKISCGR